MSKAGRKRAGVAPAVQDAMEVSRFWSLVGPSDANGCRDWLGYTDRSGYGIYVWRGERFPAHELSLTFTTGEVRSAGLQTCHSCDRPPCCAPGHLRFDTPKSNVNDMMTRGRHVVTLKLTDAQVESMRIRRSNGARVKDLARDFGVSKTVTSDTCRGLRYKSAPGPLVSSMGTGPKPKRGSPRWQTIM